MKTGNLNPGYVNLDDTPASFSGDALKVARVNAGETAIEHVDASSLGVGDAWIFKETLTFAGDLVQGSGVLSGNPTIKLVFDDLRSSGVTNCRIGIRIGAPTEYSAGLIYECRYINNVTIATEINQNNLLVGDLVNQLNGVSGEVIMNRTYHGTATRWLVAMNVTYGILTSIEKTGITGVINESGLFGVDWTNVFVRAISGTTLNGKVHVYESAH